MHHPTLTPSELACLRLLSGGRAQDPGRGPAAAVRRLLELGLIERRPMVLLPVPLPGQGYRLTAAGWALLGSV